VPLNKIVQAERSVKPRKKVKSENIRKREESGEEEKRSGGGRENLIQWLKGDRRPCQEVQIRKILVKEN